jgi:hypothetical protein
MYTQVLEGVGFTAGASNPCVFHHHSRDIAIVVHGDDFTSLGTDAELDWYEAELQKSFEVKIRGRLGEGCTGPQEIRILNRIVSVNKNGLTYEADPRHGDLLSSSLGLTSDSSAATPGVKPIDRDANASKSDEPEIPSLDFTDPDKVIAAILMGKYDSDPAECAEALSSSDVHDEIIQCLNHGVDSGKRQEILSHTEPFEVTRFLTIAHSLNVQFCLVIQARQNARKRLAWKISQAPC